MSDIFSALFGLLMPATPTSASGGSFTPIGADDSNGISATRWPTKVCEGVNPATGLPMMGVIDVGGSPYGADLNDLGHSNTHWGTSFDVGSVFDGGSFGSSWDS